MKKKLRLLVTKECLKNCEGCCNKDWDLDSLPVVGGFSNYDEIIITGGEPLSEKQYYNTKILIDYLSAWFPNTKIILYTNKSDGVIRLLEENKIKEIKINGITLTLHDQSDVEDFDDLNNLLLELFNEISIFSPLFITTFRLNIFKGVKLPKNTDLSYWEIKDNIEWMKDCPLPEGEVFMKMPNI